MTPDRTERRTGVRFEADEKPPILLAIGLGIQIAILTIGGIILTVAIVSRAGGAGEAYLSWAVFAAVAISGATTILQAVRIGRIGAGYILMMGTSGTFIAVCITAIAQGGPAMMATLIIISSLFQFVLSSRLSLLRRILTPAVSGTVIMLISVTVMPIAFDMLKNLPDDLPISAGPFTALTTILVTIGIALKATSSLRLWAPIIGVAAGSIVSSYFGLYDTARVAAASWIGLPTFNWPGINLEFGNVLGLLPAFMFVTLVGAVETVGDSIAIQRVSWRRPRAVDYRAVQGAVAADGMGNLLSGLMGTVRWSWFVGQSKGKLKVYSDWFLALDERTLPMARDDVKGIVGSSVGALVKCRSVMTGSTLPVMINHFATAVAVSPEGPERSGGAA